MRLIFIFCALWMIFPMEADQLTVAFDYGGDIYITDFSGDPVSITDEDTYEILPAWSPDGLQIAFLSSESALTSLESHLHLMTLESGDIRQLSDLPFSSEATITWSPDGQYIAITHGTIFMIELESGEVWQLPVECGACHVNWLHDSSGIIFSRGALFRIDLNGDNLQQLTTDNAIRPGLSPIANEVLFGSAAGLQRLNLDDLTIDTVADLSDYDWHANLWSPDGQSIAINVFQTSGTHIELSGGADVFVMQADGTDFRVVTDDGYDSLIAWANDSQHLLYHENEPGGAEGAYVLVNILDGTKSHLSNATMERMCAYWNCRNFTVRPD